MRRAARVLALLVAGSTGQGAAQPAPPVPDYRAIVSRADLQYDRPAPRSEEGIPFGNGRMGGLVWTSPATLKFQINRVDLRLANLAPLPASDHPEALRPSDYAGPRVFVRGLKPAGRALSGAVLTFDTAAGDVFTLTPVRGSGR